MTNSPENAFHYLGLVIHRQPKSGLICVTDIWKSQGSVVQNNPSAWLHADTTQALLRRLVKQMGATPIRSKREERDPSSEEIITSIPGILEITEEGGHLLTYSTPELAIIYARFLSVECYEWALAALVEGKEEEEEANYVKPTEEGGTPRDEIQLSRRHALIAAGWTVPVIAGIALSNQTVRAGSPVLHSDEPGHLDSGTHGDDFFHLDFIHDDGGDPHGDVHTDVDQPPPHGDFHIDIIGTHGDSPHEDHGDHLDHNGVSR